MAVAVVDVQVNSQNAVRNLNQINAASKATQTGINGLTGSIGKLAAGFSAIQAARFVFAKTAEIESQAKSLEVLTGSAQKSKQIISELQQLGAVTPFTSTELIDAAKRLQAFGIQANAVVETTRRLADVSGATGAELQGLVTAYGQVQAKGRLQGEELLQFQERGIALQRELQRMYGMSGEEFRKALEKGRFSAQAVETAIKNLTDTGGKYANGAIAQSTTLQGKFSTLQDGVDALAREIGNTLAPSLKIALDDLTAFVNGFVQGLQYMQTQYRTFLASLRGKTADELQTQVGGINKLIAENQRQLSRVDPASLTGKLIDKKLVELRKLRGSLQKDLDQKLGLVAPQGKSTLLPVTPTGGGAPPALLGETGKKDGKGTKAAEAAARRMAEQIADARSILSLSQAQFDIEGQILVARSQNNEALVTTRTAQKELAGIASEIADVRASKELPNAAKLARIADLEIKAKGVARQLAFNLATAEKEKAKNATDAMQKLIDEQALMQARLDGNEAEVLLNQQIRDLKAQYPGLNEADARSTIEKTNALKQQVDAATQLKQLYADIGMSIKDGVVGAIQGAIDGTKSLQEVATNLLNSIANKLLDVAVNFALFGAMSGTGTGGGLLGSLFKKRASGGSVTAGQPYLVGERGPELFMPGRSGGIAPTGSFGGVGNVVVNVDAGGSSVQGDPGQANQLGKVIGLAVQQELIKQKRPGGLLA